MNAHLLNTEQFWQAMCRSGFMRLSLYCGANGADLYFATIPPERAPGFVEERIAEIVRDLQLDRPHPIGDFILSIAVPLMLATLLSLYAVFLWWI